MNRRNALQALFAALAAPLAWCRPAKAEDATRTFPVNLILNPKDEKGSTVDLCGSQIAKLTTAVKISKRAGSVSRVTLELVTGFRLVQPDAEVIYIDRVYSGVKVQPPVTRPPQQAEVIIEGGRTRNDITRIFVNGVRCEHDVQAMEIDLSAGGKRQIVLNRLVREA